MTLTFFVVGQCLEKYPQLWKAAAKNGHQICNHTYHHLYLTKLSPREITNELKLWENAAEKILGKEYVEKMKKLFPFIRFPGGAGHKNQKILSIVGEENYIPIAWEKDTYCSVLKPNHYREKPVEEIAPKVAEHIVSVSQKGDIVVLHFNPWDTLCFEKMVQGILQKGLKIVSMGKIIEGLVT